MEGEKQMSPDELKSRVIQLEWAISTMLCKIMDARCEQPLVTDAEALDYINRLGLDALSPDFDTQNWETDPAYAEIEKRLAAKERASK